MTYSSGEIRVDKSDFRRQAEEEALAPPLDLSNKADEDRLVGQTLDGRYHIQGRIGSGGMSVVYKAHHGLLDKVVAIKVLHANRCDAESILRFQQEARALSALDHPNLTKVHAFGQTREGNPYLVMDFVEGHTLAELIVVHGGLPLERMLSIFNDICASLSHAHERGIVHRDLKPSNVVIDSSGSAKILDFGIAKLMPEASTQDRHLTRGGATCGSPPYMSPEQCLGEQLDARSDIYSLGCMFYETASGRRPFAGNTSEELMLKQVNEAPRPLRHSVQLPDSLEAIIYRCLEKDPKGRYQKVSEIISHLNAVGTGGAEEAAVIASSGLEQSRKTERRRHVQMIAAGVAATISIVSLAGAGAFFAFFPQGQIIRIEPEAQKFAEKKNLPKLMATARELMPLYRSTGRKQKAIDLIKNIVALAHLTLPPDSIEYANVMSEMGNQIQSFDQKEARAYYATSLHIWNKVYAWTLVNGNRDQQLRSLEQCIRLCIQSQRSKESIPYLTNMSVLYKASYELNKAKVTASRAVDMAKQHNSGSKQDQEQLLIARHQLAETLLQLKDPVTALPLFQANEKLATQLYPPTDSHYKDAVSRLADCYVMMHQTALADATRAKISKRTSNADAFKSGGQTFTGEAGQLE